MVWMVQEAKARFSEMLEASLKDGPQIVSRRGVETAVLLPIEDWRRMKQAARPSLKQLLLTPATKFSGPAAKRGRLRARPIAEAE